MPVSPPEIKAGGFGRDGPLAPLLAGRVGPRAVRPLVVAAGSAPWILGRMAAAVPAATAVARAASAPKEPRMAAWAAPLHSERTTVAASAAVASRQAAAAVSAAVAAKRTCPVRTGAAAASVVVAAKAPKVSAAVAVSVAVAAAALPVASAAAAASRQGSGSAGGGGGAGLGGAIFNMGVAGNAAFGQLTLVNCTFNQNTAQGGNAPNNATYTGGAGSGLGGAIFNLDGGVVITNSTLAGNTVAAGIIGTGTAPTIAPAGGAVYNLAFGNDITTGLAVNATVTLTNVILSNTTGGTDLDNYTDASSHTAGLDAASVNLAGPNVILTSGNTGTGSITGTTPITIDPGLALLASNGGLTQTMALRAGSSAALAGTDVPGVETDQRGVERGLVPDIGAYQMARSYTINVTSTSGGINYSTGIIEPLLGPSPTVTLRDALNAARNTGGTATIMLAAGAMYDLTSVDNYWYGPDGLPAISSNVTINGQGATIERTGTHRFPPLLRLRRPERFVGRQPDLEQLHPRRRPGPGRQQQLRRRRSAVPAGGAIFNQGTLTLISPL